MTFHEHITEGNGRHVQGRSASYGDLLSYILSNAISGEIMAVENYSEMIQIVPDCTARIETNAQAADECKHILLLAKLAKSLGLAVEQRIVEPQWNNIRRHFSTAVRRNNLAACLIIQDLMTETMAIVLYKTLGQDADTDSQTSKVARNILEDELEHLDIGINRIRTLLERSPDDVHDALIWAHHRVMPELFSMVSTNCHSLCDVLNVDCASLSLEEIKTDLDTLRIRALQQYIDALDRVGFDSSVVNPLIAGLSALDGRPVLAIKGEQGTCCAPDQAAGKCC